MPTHLGARYVTDEISVTLREEVLEARMVAGRQTLSRSVKISIFDSISSGTASMTMSASRAACSTEDAYSKRPNAALASALVTFPSSTALSRLVRISVSALRNAVGRMSSRMVRWPPSAAAWAMPRPIIPAPMTAIVRTSAIELLSLFQLLDNIQEVGIGVPHVFGETLFLLTVQKIEAAVDAAKGRGNIVH